MLIVKVHNDSTGTEEIGNYDYSVYINERRIAEGRVENFPRKYGWKDLLHSVADVEEE